MIIKDFEETLVFDELSYNKGGKHKHFISHLLNNEIKSYDVFKSCAKIYTSEFIKNILMLDYKKTEREKMPPPNKFVSLEPNVPISITLKNGKKIQVTMFESDEINKSVMFLFGQNNKPSFLYAGICSDIRSIMFFYDTFTEALEIGIDVLYLDLELANTTQYCSTYTAADQLTDLLYSNPDYKLRLLCPKFGYEEFIERAAKNIPKKILIGLPRKDVFKSAKLLHMFAKTVDEARIFVGSSTITLDTVENFYTKLKHLIVQVIPRNSTIEKCMPKGIYQINWSPHPSPVVLAAITELVRPNKIIPIAHTVDVYYMEATIPSYLQKLCRNYVKPTVFYDLHEEQIINDHQEDQEECIVFTQHPNRDETQNKSKDIQHWLSEKRTIGEKNVQDQEESIDSSSLLPRPIRTLPRRRTTRRSIDYLKLNSENEEKAIASTSKRKSLSTIKVTEQPPIVPRNCLLEYDDSISE